MITLRNVFEAVDRHFAINRDAAKPFTCCTKLEDTERSAAAMVVGLSWAFGILKAETGSMICIEDSEYDSLLKDYVDYLRVGEYLTDRRVRIAELDKDCEDFKSLRFYNKYLMCMTALRHAIHGTYAYKYGKGSTKRAA